MAEEVQKWFLSDAADARLPRPERRLRLGIVGGGRGAFIGEIHAMGARLSNCWEVVAGSLSSDPTRAKASGADWYISDERAYTNWTERRNANLAATTVSKVSRSQRPTICIMMWRRPS